jgi:hypothetical protein
MNTADPRGYYAALGVDPKADVAEIRAAYRRRAKDLHPDRNPGPRAKEEFQLLVAAYETLGNPEKRAEYDTLASASTVDRATKRTHESTEVIEPIQCSSCGTVSEQPRYVVFWTVMSFLLVTIRKPTQGVLCHHCAGDKAIKASVLTWLLGWWGIPWGPMWSIYYLLRNLLGGDKPSDANAALLGRHALAFAQGCKYALANAVIQQALLFASNSNIRTSLEHLRESMKSSDKTDSYSSLKDAWNPLRWRAFYVQLIPFIVLSTIFFIDVDGVTYMKNMASLHNDRPSLSNQPYLYTSPTAPTHIPRSDEPPVSKRNEAALSIWHVTTKNLNIRRGPNPRKSTVGDPLPRFTSIAVLDNANPEWAKVRASDEREGYVKKRFTSVGAGEQARIDVCREQAGVPVGNGSILRQIATGNHVLRIKNGLEQDAVVKLKSLSNHTVLSLYVSAHSDAEIREVPEGKFRVVFATGREYSRLCGFFLKDMYTQAFDESSDFVTTEDRYYSYSTSIEYTLHRVASGNATARPFSVESFLQD